MNRPVTQGPLLILGASALFGSTGTAQALGPAGANSFTVGLIRLVIGGAGLAAAAIVLHRVGPLGLTSRPAIALGAAAVLAYQLAFFAGVRASGVAIGTVITIGSAPVLTGLISWVALGERPGRRWAISTAVAILGIVLIAGPAGGANVEGVLLNLTAGLSYAVFASASKRLLDTQPPLGAMAVMFGGGAVLAAPLLLFGDVSFLRTGDGLAMALWLGFAATTLAYVLYGYGLRSTPVATAATLTLLEPVVATVLGVAILTERPAVSAWVGMALVLLALGVLISRTDRPVRASVAPS